MTALHESIAALHAKVFANYERWVRRLSFCRTLTSARRV